MRIDASDVIAGQPALRIRELLRRTRPRFYALDERLASEVLEVNAATAAHVVQELVQLGYAEREERDRWYEVNSKGIQLMLATAARPVRRATAERQLAAFLDRVHIFNDDDSYLCRVERVWLFGSFLDPARDRLSDVDLAIELHHRAATFAEHLELQKLRVLEERAMGRQFGNLAVEMGWDFREAYLALRAGQRTLSLHPADSAEDRAWLAERPNRLVYDHACASERQPLDLTAS